MATGDIINPTIVTETNGMTYLSLTFVGLATNGTFDFGMGENNDPTNAKVVLAVTSPAYDDSASATTVDRTVYGTMVMRKAYPNEGQNDVTVSGSDAVAHIAISDFIFSGDTVTIAVDSGLYTAGSSTNAVAAGTSVTNNSTNTHAKCVGQFVTVPYQRVTDDFTVEFFGGHRSAKNGKPLACVEFIATDQHSHTETVTVTDMTLSPVNASGIRLPVYSTTISVDNFTDGDTLTVNIKAYPWVGNTGSILDSSIGVDGVAQPDERLGPLSFLLDKSGTVLPPLYCVVDAATGNDTTGVASTTLATAEGSRCQTIAGAKTKAAAIRANGENVVIYLVNGNYAFDGSVNAWNQTSPSRVWTTIEPHPTLGTQSNCIINSGNNTNANGKIKFKDLNLSNASVGALRGNSSTGLIWVDSCTINLSGMASIYGWRLCFATDNIVTSLNGHFTNFSTNPSPWKLIRGNDATAVSGGVAGHLYAVVSNSNVTPTPVFTASAVNMQASNNAVWAYNTRLNSPVGEICLFNGVTSYPINLVSNSSAGATTVTLKSTQNIVIMADAEIMFKGDSQVYKVQSTTSINNTTGSAVSISPGLAGALNGSVTPIPVKPVYQGLLAACNAARRTTSGTPAIQFAADNSTGNQDNILLWHNTIAIGEGADPRCNLGYNDNGDNAPTRLNWSMVGNSLSQYNNKDDTFITQNAARTGAWTVGYMLGCHSNIIESSLFPAEFWGLNTPTPPQTQVFVDVTLGDLRPTSTSLSRQLIQSGQAVLPYDLDGNTFDNYGRGTSGAYQYEDDITTTPTVSTTPATNITTTTATLGGNITDDGGATITQRGVCYSTSPNPTISDSKVVASGTTGVFSVTLSGLTAGVTYYARAYAVNSVGVAYGNQVLILVSTSESERPSVVDRRQTTIIVKTSRGYTVTQSDPTRLVIEPNKVVNTNLTEIDSRITHIEQEKVIRVTNLSNLDYGVTGIHDKGKKVDVDMSKRRTDKGTTVENTSRGATVRTKTVEKKSANGVIIDNRDPK